MTKAWGLDPDRPLVVEFLGVFPHGDPAAAAAATCGVPTARVYQQAAEGSAAAGSDVPVGVPAGGGSARAGRVR